LRCGQESGRTAASRIFSGRGWIGSSIGITLWRSWRVRLTGAFLEERCGAAYTDRPGHPPPPARLMAGLAILKHMFNLSDVEGGPWPKAA
jgi:hypothetical protein